MDYSVPIMPKTNLTNPLSKKAKDINDSIKFISNLGIYNKTTDIKIDIIPTTINNTRNHVKYSLVRIPVENLAHPIINNVINKR